MPFKPTTLLSRSLAASRLPLRNSIHSHRHVRPFSLTSTRAVDHNTNDKHEAMKDREKLNPDADENAVSGTDNTAAENESAAFNPNISDPQEAKKEAGKGNDVNPLDASPANPDISQPTSETEGGAKKKISEGGGGRQAKDEGKGNESI